MLLIGFAKRHPDFACGTTLASTIQFLAVQLTVWSIMFFSMLAPTPFRQLFSVEQGARDSARRSQGSCAVCCVIPFHLFSWPLSGAVFSTVSVPGVDLTAQKLAFVGAQLIGVMIVLWKLNAMGLLPLTSADWVSLLPALIPAEQSSLGWPL